MTPTERLIVIALIAFVAGMNLSRAAFVLLAP